MSIQIAVVVVEEDSFKICQKVAANGNLLAIKLLAF